MKNLLIIILAVFLVGCGKPQEVKDMQLMQASMGGNIESVKMLLESGANVNFRDSSGRTSLHKASGLAVTMFSSGEHKEITELLIRNGANVNAKTNSGETPLDIAVQSGNIQIAEFLRKNGGKHGLIVWAVGRGGDIESVKNFINAGVDVNTKLAGTGSTLLDLAIGDQQEEIADLLRKHGGKTREELKAEGK